VKKHQRKGFTMVRVLLTDEFWSRLRNIFLHCGAYDTENLRMTVEGILYKLRVGCPWRDVPEFFGNWNALFKRFNEWSSQGKLLKIFLSLSKDPDHEWTFIDGSIVKAHQHSAGAIHGSETAIGKSVAGNSTKIHLAVDAMGLPIHFIITGGEVHDSKEAQNLIDKIPQLEILIADKGYDNEALRTSVQVQGADSHIPRKRNSKIGNEKMDWCLYKYRHLVENAFARLKHFRSIATRYEKLKRNYEGMLHLACSIMWLPM
jgi:transposase